MDSKCYLGAMKPGDGKAHKACAILCVSGGIPPVLIYLDSTGKRRSSLLTDPTGGPVNDHVLPLIGEPIEIRGTPGTLGPLPLMAIESLCRVP